MLSQKIIRFLSDASMRQKLSIIGFSNIVYAISKAKGDDNIWVRSISFLCGFPLSVLTLVSVTEGSNKAYGISLKFLD
jgi:hypothetical protein